MGIYNEDVEVSEITIGKIDDGQKYIASTGRQELADDGSVTVYFENPAGSSLDAYVVLNTAPSADAELEVSEDVDQDGTGSALDVLNAKVGSAQPSGDIVRTGDSYTVNGTTISYNIPGGSNAGPGSGGGSSVDGPTTFLVGPGTSMLYELYNRSGGTGGVGLSVSWFEVDL